MADRSDITLAEVRERIAAVATTDAARREAERALSATAEEAGDAALQRALQIATVLLDLSLDAESITAAVVHCAVASELDAEALAERFGQSVAALVVGVRRLDAIRWDSLDQVETETLRKMFLAMASDVRVILIALVHKLQQMRELDALDPPQRQALAEQTMEVFAPLANRLGIWQLKWELEDLAFRELQPQTYREIGKLLAEKRSIRRKTIDTVMATLLRELAGLDVKARLSGRPKHIYSIYRKMERKRLGFDQIYDVTALRVIVDEVAQCYAVLGLVHGLWTPVSGEFDDYIAKPKPNGYRSLHTAVVGPTGQPLEIQIRTHEMHEFGEFGVAAHWRYKEAKKSDRRFDEKINWLRQLMQWQRDVTDPQEVAQSLKHDLFGDQVYVFTPTGAVIDLPLGATPIDFAYRIHTQVGHRCRGARVNDAIVTLDTKLKTGDRVEIITQKNGTPSRDWLNPHLGYVHTGSARQKIRQYFREMRRDASVIAGREAVERELKRLGISDTKIDDVALLCDFDDADDFLAKVGFGDVSTQHVAARLLEAERAKAPPADPLPSPAAARDDRPRGADSVSLGGVSDVMSTPAKCCHPVPGDAVLGYVTRGRGLVIHRADCPNMKNHPEPERVMALDWGARYGSAYPVEVRVAATDRAGLLRDIADVVATEGVNMRSVSAEGKNRNGEALVALTLEIRNNEQLLRVMAKLDRMPYIDSVRRVAG
ncbi:MAG: bifunctional (p)ppGpp synthetase/guanosine-3',5'-bis(diphosphate) 3'-pyrophosphohydrolase [Myxococcota bacterium]